MMFECPQCHKKTFTRIQKVSCGSLKSKGKKCPECGAHCVNGMSSTVFHTVVNLAALALWIALSVVNFGDNKLRALILLGALVVSWLLGAVFDAFCGKLAKTMRMDIREGE